MVSDIRNIEKALGSISYDLTSSVEKNYWARRSLYVSENIKKGEQLKGKIKSVRPGYGLHPKHFDEVSYYYATQDLEVGDRLAWDVISKEKN